mgnify:CR=1 FL=1
MVVRVRHDEAEWFRIFRSPTGVVARYVEDLTRQGANRARQLAPVDTGSLRASVSTSVFRRGGKLVGSVHSLLDYAIFVHEGTGIYGPRHRIIKPRRAQVLVFRPRGGPTVFARSVKGQQGQPFLVRAIHEVLPTATFT